MVHIHVNGEKSGTVPVYLSLIHFTGLQGNNHRQCTTNLAAGRTGPNQIVFFLKSAYQNASLGSQ